MIERELTRPDYGSHIARAADLGGVYILINNARSRHERSREGAAIRGAAPGGGCNRFSPQLIFSLRWLCRLGDSGVPPSNFVYVVHVSPRS